MQSLMGETPFGGAASLLPIAYCLLPLAYCLLPIPYSHVRKWYSLRTKQYRFLIH
ncbi:MULTISPECIES: hypothetical protein [unclassified Moorena]|uniref:hypothetical protein n=1 Tax=unclassified Moorena TaxID=2683338 RepID=UPI0013FF3302|nr:MULTISPECIES: hypothetical protein [unclassified Moorena]NEO11536.1 hypothetical protein [Moorena sp. SIO3E8]NEP97996.1 hypothetical protein [Moorena sp. SIO3F7]